MKESEKQELISEAVGIAKSIIAGDTDPNKGSAKLGDLNKVLDWPKELSAFGLLSHEQYDHENIGITAESCIPEIVDECKKLVEKYS